MLADKEVHDTIYNVDITNLIPQNNRVLCKRLVNNLKGIGRNGLYYPESFNKNQYLYQNANRAFEVVKIPNKIKPIKGGWACDIEIIPGDYVWLRPIEALNSPMIKSTDGEEYFLVDYYSLIVAKRKVDTITNKDCFIRDNGNNYQVIPLNGYVLCSDVYDHTTELNGIELLTKRILSTRKAMVEFVGSKNKYYNFQSIKNLDYCVDIKKGDIILQELVNKNDKIITRNYLEDSLWSIFNGDKMYFYIQRIRINGVLTD